MQGRGAGPHRSGRRARRVTGVLWDRTAEAIPDQSGAGTAVSPRMAAEDRSRVLLNELQHRVRNSMATVRSIARHSATAGCSIEEYVQQFDGLTAALARVQSAAIQEPLAGLDLELLLRDALTVLVVPDRQVRVGGPRSASGRGSRSNWPEASMSLSSMRSCTGRCAARAGGSCCPGTSRPRRGTRH